MANVTQAFSEIIEANDLTLIGVEATRRNDGVVQWTGCVQWKGFSRTGISCSHGHGSTPETAIEDALAVARISRTPIEGCAIPTLEIAA